RRAHHDRVVVRLVASRVDEGEGAATCPAHELAQHFAGGRRAELLLVPGQEGSPPPRIVAEPAAQAVARRKHLRPDVEPQLLPAKPPGPQPIDEHAIAVPWRGRLVGALDPNRHPRRTRDAPYRRRSARLEVRPDRLADRLRRL